MDTSDTSCFVIMMDFVILSRKYYITIPTYRLPLQQTIHNN